MTYEVRLQPLAERDLEDAYLWAASHAPQTASQWLGRFREALASLGTNPERCGAAVEALKLKRPLRQLVFGRKPSVYRAVFMIDGPIVRVVRIRRASRRSLRPQDLG